MLLYKVILIVNQYTVFVIDESFFLFLHQHPLMRAHRKCDKFKINTTLISTYNCIVNHSLNVFTLFMIITSLYNKKTERYTFHDDSFYCRPVVFRLHSFELQTAECTMLCSFHVVLLK